MYLWLCLNTGSCENSLWTMNSLCNPCQATNNNAPNTNCAFVLSNVSFEAEFIIIFRKKMLFGSYLLHCMWLCGHIVFPASDSALSKVSTWLINNTSGSVIAHGCNASHGSDCSEIRERCWVHCPMSSVQLIYTSI